MTAMAGENASRPAAAPTRSKRRFDSRIDLIWQTVILYTTK